MQRVNRAAGRITLVLVTAGAALAWIIRWAENRQTGQWSDLTPLLWIILACAVVGPLLIWLGNRLHMRGLKK